jgi:hypothetical protein
MLQFGVLYYRIVGQSRSLESFNRDCPMVRSASTEAQTVAPSRLKVSPLTFR